MNRSPRRRAPRPRVRALPLAPTAAPADREPPPPDHISVDHILIGVKSPSFPDGKRDAATAKTFAYDLLAKIRAGADWAKSKREHSEDPPPGGPYGLANRGVKPTGRGEYPRDQMVPAFGDVGFSLEVGAIGMADFDARTSPFGYHLIKRVS